MNIKFPDDLLLKSNLEITKMVIEMKPKIFAKCLVKYLKSGGLKELEKMESINVLKKIATAIEIAIALSDSKRGLTDKPSKPNPIIDQNTIDNFMDVYNKGLLIT